MQIKNDLFHSRSLEYKRDLMNLFTPSTNQSVRDLKPLTTAKAEHMLVLFSNMLDVSFVELEWYV